jgi:hypothetical protein
MKYPENYIQVNYRKREQIGGFQRLGKGKKSRVIT